MQEFTFIQQLAIWALPVVFAVTVHEAAHGFVARALGDDTASRLGRLTLNPIKHIDPVGTLLVPGLMLLGGALLGAGGIIFGWAKPVPINASRFRDPRRGMAYVAIAGPLSNLIMAIGWAIGLKLIVASGTSAAWGQGVAYMCFAGVLINLILLVLNLLPVPPLDGSRVVAAVLPRDAAIQYMKIEPYGLVILILLLATGVLGFLIGPPMAGLRHALFRILGISL